MAKYPDEAPVFRMLGKDYEVRPCMSKLDDVAYGLLMAVKSDGEGFVWSVDFPLYFDRPLTRAARELLAWVRQ